LFFIVSGFALSLSYERERQKHKALQSYIVRRFFRIYPLWILAVLTFKLSGSHQGDFLTNASFFFGFIRWQSPNPEIVIGGWSLFCEVIYYMFLPIILKIVRGSCLRALGLVIFSIFMRITWLKTAEDLGFSDVNSFIGLFPISNFYCFCLGIGLFVYRSEKRSNEITNTKPMFVFVLILLIMTLSLGFVDQVVIALLMTILLALSLQIEKSTKRNFFLLGKIGQYCYSIYLFQYVVLELIILKLFKPIPEISFPFTFMVLIGFISLMVGLGYVVNQTIEVPINKLSRFLVRKLEKH
jgi:peptidoglycan/LPS O-acetylase OafA/YrhL